MKTSVIQPFVLLFIILSSCGSDNTDSKEAGRIDPDSVNIISGYGRTSSLSDIIHITTEVSGTVDKLMVEESDSIATGDTLFIIRHDELLAGIKSLSYDIGASTEVHRITQNSLNTALITLNAREKNYNRLKESRQRGTVSQQSLDDARLLYQQSSGRIKELEIELQRQNKNIESLRYKLRQQEIRLAKHFYIAVDSGIVLDLDIERNMPLNALNSIGRYRTPGPYSIDAELDELYAGILTRGQQAVAVPYGRTDTIAWATIVKVSPVLSDKSIFSENEGGFMDRRVRTFELRIDSASKPLLIGQRVNIFIKLR